MSRPVVRNALNNAWVDVFCKGGWKMKMPDGSFLTLTAANLKLRNPENTGWMGFYCPLAPPKTVSGGSVRSNRLVDTAGFLWCTGFATGIYEDGTMLSATWQKVKYVDDIVRKDQYINGIKHMECRDALYLLTQDGKIFVSGDYGPGLWATGINATATGLKTYWVTEQTANWEFKLGKGNVARIAQISADGTLLTEDGIAYAVGIQTSYYTPPFTGAKMTRECGFMGAGDSGAVIQYGIDTKASVIASWSRLLYSSDRVNSEVLSGIVSMSKDATGITFALRDDGKLLQAPYWFTSGAKTQNPNGLPTPKSRYDSMIDTLPFTDSTPVFLHPGAILEAANGSLYYAKRQMHFNGDSFWDYKWIDTGINLNALGSKVKRIVGYVFEDNIYSMVLSIFILMEDGKLYAAGDNAPGWFGLGSATKTVPLNTPRLINSNVDDFDSYANSTFAMKKDGTMWGCGANANSRLGIGPTKTDYNYYDWQQCIFTSI